MPRPRIYRSNADRQAAYRQRKRKRQPVQFWHKSDEWETPPELFVELEREFHFSTDVAALPDNAKCPHISGQSEPVFEFWRVPVAEVRSRQYDPMCRPAQARSSL